MGKQFRWYFIVIALSLLSCNNEVFSSFPRAENLTSLMRVTSLIAVPRQHEYFLGDVFNPNEDLTVLGVFPDGITRTIPIKEVVLEGDMNFTVPGLKDIQVTYQDKQTLFTLLVRDPPKEQPPGDTTIEIPLPNW